MGVTTHPPRERRLLRTQYTSLTAALARFLCPQVFKQAHQAHRPKKTASRWDLHPLLMVLLLMVGALVLLPAGLLGSWAVGPGTASEHDLLRQLLPSLPRGTLLVADAFYQGYDLYTDLLRAKASFLVRLSSKSQLYTQTR